MVLCFAARCNHRSVKDGCSFFRFPKDKKLRSLWIKFSRRADTEPNDDARLCSCHFKDGKKINNPSGYFNLQEVFNFSSPEKPFQRIQNVSVNDGNQTEPSPEITNTRLDVIILQSQLDALQIENASLKEELKNRLYFSFNNIRDKPDLVLMYTGLPNAELFDVVLNYIQDFPFQYYHGWTPQMPLEDQLFITLQKLRLNYNFQDLAVRYSVCVTTIRNIFLTLIHVIHESMYEFVYGPASNIPSVHKTKEDSPIATSYPNCRFLLDCTEVFIETPRSDMEAQKQSYSSYKKAQTAKALIAVSPSGRICFCSNLYPGSFSDKLIVESSGICNILRPGDLIIADKGFLITDMLPKGVMLNMPPFLLNPQFSEEQVKYTTQIARARIHVERSIQRIKSFEILHRISHNFQPILTKIFQVCVLLVNLQTPVLSDMTDTHQSTHSTPGPNMNSRVLTVSTSAPGSSRESTFPSTNGRDKLTGL